MLPERRRSFPPLPGGLGPRRFRLGSGPGLDIGFDRDAHGPSAEEVPEPRAGGTDGRLFQGRLWRRHLPRAPACG